MLRTRVFLFSVLICLFTCLFTACESDNFTIGKDWLESNTRMIKVDTFTVNTSTVWVDSIVTSNKGIFLIGQYNDAYVGKMEASSYLELSVPTISTEEEIDKRAVLDSMMIHLAPNGDYFGDTTSVQQIDIYKTKQTLTFREVLNLNNGLTYPYMFNSSSTEVENTPIDRKSVV